MVVAADVGLWDEVIEFARTLAQSGVAVVESDPIQLPSARALFALGHLQPVRLSVSIGAMSFVAHFFDEAEVEFDFNPADVRFEDEDVVLQFIESLAIRLHRPVSLTPENAHDRPIATYEPVSRLWTCPGSHL